MTVSCGDSSLLLIQKFPENRNNELIQQSKIILVKKKILTFASTAAIPWPRNTSGTSVWTKSSTPLRFLYRINAFSPVKQKKAQITILKDVQLNISKRNTTFDCYKELLVFLIPQYFLWVRWTGAYPSWHVGYHCFAMLQSSSCQVTQTHYIGIPEMKDTKAYVLQLCSRFEGCLWPLKKNCCQETRGY